MCLGKNALEGGRRTVLIIPPELRELVLPAIERGQVQDAFTCAVVLPLAVVLRGLAVA